MPSMPLDESDSNVSPATDPTVRLCGARTRSGGTCQQKAVRGRSRCRMHGGTVPRGPAHHAFRHGRYSRDLPTNLEKRYRASLADPKLLEHRDDVALLDLRVSELVRRLHDGDSGEFRSDLKEAWLAVEDAGDADEKQAALSHVGWLINEAVTDEFTWTELRECVDHRGRIASRKHARMKLMSEFMPYAEVDALLGAVCEGINLYVKDQHERHQVSRHLVEVMTPRYPSLATIDNHPDDELEPDDEPAAAEKFDPDGIF